MKLKERLFCENGGLMLLEISRLQGPNAETTKIFRAKELESATKAQTNMMKAEFLVKQDLVQSIKDV